MLTMKYEGQKTYALTLCGLKRELPVRQVGPDLWIPSFVMLGDVQLINVCAGALAGKLAAVDFDLLVGPEAKVVPLLQSIATLLGHSRYVVCRKTVKAYMKDPVVVEAQSITTHGKQTLVLDGVDAARVRGKKVVVVDDVVSTGGSLEAVEELLAKAGAQVVARAAVLKESDAYKGDLIYLQEHPIITR